MAENNYTHDNIDRIVFIGGPSRIPYVRQTVSNELGIAADMKTDPMTAVALGAAYYCEGRTWNADNVSAPKPTEAAVPVAAEPMLAFAYASRTPDDKTVVTLQVKGDAPSEQQVEITSGAWHSGALPLLDGLTVSVPLPKMGEHLFDVHVLDAKGVRIPAQEQKITITRLVAATGGIPAAQTIAVKTLDHAFAQENSLLSLVKKGDILPASGQVKFKSARLLKAHEAGSIGFELFQVEYPERIDLNLCVGMFRIGGNDLPDGTEVKDGDPLIFDWKMNDSGVLHATVQLEATDTHPLIELKVPRFYAPQAGQVAFNSEQGVPFATAILKQGEEEWGDLAAAVGPDAGPEVQLLKTRMIEQRETLEEAGNDAETIRRVTEEARFVRQDIARVGKKHRAALLQRKLGKMTAVYNRLARAFAEKAENERFDNHAAGAQKIIDDTEPLAFDDADLHLAEMRDLFFIVAWRDPNYVYTWYKRLVSESYLFPDTVEFAAMVAEGETLQTQGANDKLRDLVHKMLNARVALGTSDTASELATIVKG